MIDRISAGAIRTCISSVLLLVAFHSSAQRIDAFELGRLKGSAVAHAIWLDRYAATCQGDSVTKYWNLLDNFLRAGWQHGAEDVLLNSAKIMGTSVGHITGSSIKQYEQQKKELGSCKSKKFRNWIEQVQTSFSNHLAILGDSK